MTDFDEKLRQMATAEDTPVPDGFDARLADTLSGLPGGARRLRRGLRIALIAACLCAAVVGTTMAVSPTMREYLAKFWGLFLPYTQDIDDVTYVSDGIEVKVISAMADGAMAKVYIQARDLEGDRLYYGMGTGCSLRRKKSPSGLGNPSTASSSRCVSFDEETGIALIAHTLNQVLQPEQSTTVLLETMAGKGSEIGGCFEELREILDRTALSGHAGVCLDTCHVWDAGYDIAGHLDQVLDQFDRVIGLDRLKAVHLNDSQNPLGSRKDRHARIGEGCIGLDALIRVVRHPALKDLPFYLETPNDLDGYAREIRMLQEAAAAG